MAAPWPHPGLRFECTMCGACCSGSEGYVLFTDDEARHIAGRLGVTVEQFLDRYTHDMGVEIAGRRRSLNEVPTEHGLDCVFLDRATSPGKALCSIHDLRPLQCRTFPFWPEHVRDESAWRRLGRDCEGVGRGAFIPVEQLRVQTALHRADRGIGEP